MFKKFNLKTVSIIFIALLVIVVLVMVYDNIRGDKTYELKIAFNPEKATSLRITTKADINNELLVSLRKDGWYVEKQGKAYPADSSKIYNLLRELSNLKAERVAAVDKSKWTDFEVTDSTAVRVLVKKDNKKLADVYIGKFSYQNPTNYYQRQGTMTTYVRLAKEDVVYAVNGFLRMTFNADFNSFRNNKLIQGESREWTKLTFNYPADSSFVLIKEENKWMIDGIIADSSKVAGYLSTLSRLSSTYFIEDTLNLASRTLFKVTVEGMSLKTPVVLSAAPADAENIYAVYSSNNVGNVFSGSKNDLFNKIFISKNRLLGQK